MMQLPSHALQQCQRCKRSACSDVREGVGGFYVAPRVRDGVGNDARTQSGGSHITTSVAVQPRGSRVNIVARVRRHGRQLSGCSYSTAFCRCLYCKEEECHMMRPLCFSRGV